MYLPLAIILVWLIVGVYRLGQTLWNQFFLDKDWPGASAIAVVLLILLVGPILVYQHGV